VAGEAALLVDPDDEGAMAQALLSLVEDAALRERLARAGIARAREFTWARCADRTVGIYRTVARA
jgi:alpha-1,3-rhamnosyl/mannosyltransferase